MTRAVHAAAVNRDLWERSSDREVRVSGILFALALFCSCESQRPAHECIDLGGNVTLTTVTGAPTVQPGTTTCNVFGSLGETVRTVVSGGDLLYTIAIPKDDAPGPKAPYDANAVPSPGHFTFALTVLPGSTPPTCEYRYVTDGSSAGAMTIDELGDAPGTAFAGTFQQVVLSGESLGVNGAQPDPACPDAGTLVVDGSFAAAMQR